MTGLLKMYKNRLRILCRALFSGSDYISEKYFLTLYAFRCIITIPSFFAMISQKLFLSDTGQLRDLKKYFLMNYDDIVR